MDAGRQLDALIAEKVMGHRVLYYSTDISAAWLVVEELNKRGYWCQMRTPFQAGDDGDGYWAGFTPHGVSGWNGRPDHWTSAETLPLAICLAALRVGEG